RAPWIAGAALALLAAALPLGAQATPPTTPPATPPAGAPTGAPGAGGRAQPGAPRPIPRGVLGNVPMTAEDSAIARVVARLDFDSYKALIKGLTAFGDREQGTERNERANDWIEQQLRSWGYETERVRYEYRPRVDAPPEPREQVIATKWGST